MTAKTVLEIVNEAKAKSWNEAIAPRAPALLSYLAADEWVKGISAWLRFFDGEMTTRLKFGCKTRDDDQFVRGQLAVLHDILTLPQQIENYLDAIKEREKQSASRGPAGY